MYLIGHTKYNINYAGYYNTHNIYNTYNTYTYNTRLARCVTRSPASLYSRPACNQVTGFTERAV